MVLKKLVKKNVLKPQSGMVVMVENYPIALFNLNGEYIAMDNTCPHQGGSLGMGELKGDIVRCPWHGWKFNCRTGAAIHNSEIVVQRYSVFEKDDGIYLDWSED